MRTWTLILCGLALLLPMVAGPSTAAEPEMWLWGPGGNPADIDRDVLWLDNPDFDANTGSSEIMGDYDLETEIANDFLLPVEATIEKVTWWGSYWGTDDPFGTGFNLRFYYRVDCLPEAEPFVEYILDDNAGETLAEGGDMLRQYVYEYCLCLPLPAGQYWFSAQMADHVFIGQWGRLGADMTQLCDSAFRSEYFSYPEWVPCPDVFGDDYDASQMFEDECEATAIENASWGAVKGLYR